MKFEKCPVCLKPYGVLDPYDPLFCQKDHKHWDYINVVRARDKEIERLKEEFKSQWAIYEPNLNNQVVLKLQAEERIRKAIEQLKHRRQLFNRVSERLWVDYMVKNLEGEE